MQKDFSKTRILLVSSDEKEALSLESALKSLNFTHYRTLSSVESASFAISAENFDIVIINHTIKDEIEGAGGFSLCDKEDKLLNILENMYCGVIFLVFGNNYSGFTDVAERHGALILPKPVSKQTLGQTIKLLSGARNKFQSSEFIKAHKQLSSEELRLINRAKFALIQHLRMDEESAHKYIEKQAMNTRKPKREIAEAIIKIYEK